MTKKQTTPETDVCEKWFGADGDPLADLRKIAADMEGGLWGGLAKLTVQEARWVMIERLKGLSDAQLMEEAKSIISQYWEDSFWVRYGGDCDAPARMMWRLDRVLAQLGARLPELEAHDDLCARKYDERHALADREEAEGRSPLTDGA